MNTHPLLASYVPFVEYLGQVFGENCEILLYDMTAQPVSIIAIANGHISGRKVGSIIMDTTLETVTSPKYQDQNFIINYPCATIDVSRTLRSSAYRIKDDTGETIGLFCINYDVTDWLTAQRLLSKFPPFTTSVATPRSTEAEPSSTPLFQEFSSPSLEETLHHAINQLLQEYSVSPDRLTKSEKQQIVFQMYNRGLFTFKGSVSLLAKKMGVSEQTIYRYLRECSNKE